MKSPRRLAADIINADNNDKRKLILDGVEPEFKELVILMVNNEFEMRKFRRGNYGSK